MHPKFCLHVDSAISATCKQSVRWMMSSLSLLLTLIYVCIAVDMHTNLFAFMYVHMYRISSYMFSEYFLIKVNYPDIYYTC